MHYLAVILLCLAAHRVTRLVTMKMSLDVDIADTPGFALAPADQFGIQVITALHSLAKEAEDGGYEAVGEIAIWCDRAAYRFEHFLYTLAYRPA